MAAPKTLGLFFVRMPQWAIMCVCVSACSRLGQPHLCGTKLDDAGDNLAYAGDPRIFIDFLFRRRRI